MIAPTNLSGAYSGAVQLAIDTSTAVTSVAVLGGDVHLERRISDRSPGDVLTQLVDELMSDANLARADLSGVAVGVGPGPYTSVRVGVATANAIGLALQIPVVGVCSLDAIAASVTGGDVVVATDARRKEIYWAYYRSGTRIVGPDVGRPADIVRRYGDAGWYGNGLDRYPELAAQVTYRQALPDARRVAEIARNASTRGEQPVSGGLVEHGDAVVDDELVGHQIFHPTPLYLRRPDAKPAAAQ